MCHYAVAISLEDLTHDFASWLGAKKSGYRAGIQNVNHRREWVSSSKSADLRAQKSSAEVEICAYLPKMRSMAARLSFASAGASSPSIQVFNSRSSSGDQS